MIATIWVLGLLAVSAPVIEYAHRARSLATTLAAFVVFVALLSISVVATELADWTWIGLLIVIGLDTVVMVVISARCPDDERRPAGPPPERGDRFVSPVTSRTGSPSRVR